MRRALLTGRPATGVTVGTIPASDNANNAARAFYAPNNPASGTGTLTTGTVKLAASASIYFFTVNPSTMTVRAVSATVSATTGLGTYAISLAVVAGDYIGVASSVSVGLRSAAGGTFAGSTTAPSVGSSVSSYTAGSGTLCLSAST